MNNTTNDTLVKLQIPMLKSVRDELEARALSLGFSSAQEYIRVWAKAQADGRVLNFDENNWGQPTEAAASRLIGVAAKTREELRKGKLQSYNGVEDFMKDLR